MGPFSGGGLLSFSIAKAYILVLLQKKKLATLLVLASAQRVQTISLIKRNNIRFGNPTIIRIPDRVKTSGINRNQPFMSFPKFEDHPALCIVTILLYYMDKTKHVLPDATDALLLTYGKRLRHKQSVGGLNKPCLGAESIHQFFHRIRLVMLLPRRLHALVLALRKFVVQQVGRKIRLPLPDFTIARYCQREI